MRMRTNTPAVDTRPKFFALPSFRRVTYAKNFGLGTRLTFGRHVECIVMDSSAASNSIMALTTTASSTSACTITSLLLNCQSLDGRAIDDIRVQLCKRTVKELGALAKSLGVRLGGSIRKADIIERLLSMARIGAVRDVSSQPNSGGVDDFIGISYITPAVIGALQQLPTFESISQWKKETKGCLKDFMFMNLLIYLVYGVVCVVLYMVQYTSISLNAATFTE